MGDNFKIRTMKDAPTDKEKAQKVKLVNAEYRRIKRSFNGAPENVMRILDSQIREAAYARITLQEWKTRLDDEGWTELFQQSINVEPYQRRKPMADMYLNLLPNYQKMMDKLAGYYEEIQGRLELEGDDFDDFTQNTR